MNKNISKGDTEENDLIKSDQSQTAICRINQCDYAPNRLDQRFNCTYSDLVWLSDFTELTQVKIKYSNRKASILTIFDLASGKIIDMKVFTKIKSRGSIDPKKVVEFFELAINSTARKYPLLIHTDRASEFASVEFRKMIEKYTDIYQSMSRSHIPQDNGPMERFNRTYKSQMKEAEPFPLEFENLSALIEFVEKRKNYYNFTFKPKRSLGFTPAILHAKLKNSNTVDPMLILAKTNKKVYDSTADQIIYMKKEITKLHSDEFYQLEKQIKNSMEFTANELKNSREMQVQLINESRKKEQSDKLSISGDQTEKKQKSVKRPLRPPLSKHFFDLILNLEKKEHFRSINFIRFKLLSIVLYTSGSRLGEAGSLSLKDFHGILENLECRVYLSKTDRYRNILFAPQVKEYLEPLKMDINTYFEKHKLLRGTLKPPHLIKWFNEYLYSIPENQDKEIKSHSFRINYITKLIKAKGLIYAQHIIGHTSAATTTKYFRWNPNKIQDLKTLETIFDENQ